MTHSKLTPKQEAFAQHYALHGSATAAFRAAGYTTRSAKPETVHRRAIEVMQNLKVAARIEELQLRVKERAEHVFDITADRILQELAAIGFANLQDFFTLDAKGQPEFSVKRLGRHHWAAIGELTVDEIQTGNRISKRTRFKLLDKKGALVELAKHIGIDGDKQKHHDDMIQNAADQLIAGVDQFAARLEGKLRGDEASADGTPTTH